MSFKKAVTYFIRAFGSLLLLAACSDAALAIPVTNYTPIEVPGAAITIVDGINDSKVTVGTSFLPYPNGYPHGFLLQAGAFTPVDVPGAFYEHRFRH